MRVLVRVTPLPPPLLVPGSFLSLLSTFALFAPTSHSPILCLRSQ